LKLEKNKNVGLDENKAICSIDISNNYIEEEKDLIDFISSQENLQCVYLRGNPVLRSISTYRKVTNFII